MKKIYPLFLLLVCLGGVPLVVPVSANAQYNYTTLSVPGAEDTYAVGICGNNIVGSYYNGSSWYAFLYIGSSYTTLNIPGAVYTYDWAGATASGISGNNIVGSYFNGNSDV